MDDGSDHDHDSHIMVWQVRDQHQNCNFVRDDPNAAAAAEDSVDKKEASASPQLSNNTLNVKADLESRYSRSSTSSVDLGPAPGSGLVTADASEVSDNEGGPGNGCTTGLDRTISMGLEMTESMTASSLMQFNRDVESMLEHGDEPKEDFTQHIDN